MGLGGRSLAARYVANGSPRRANVRLKARQNLFSAFAMRLRLIYSVAIALRRFRIAVKSERFGGSMRHVILASHHHFAQGLAETLEFLGAKTEFKVICAYVDDRPLAPQIEEVFSAIDPADEVLVLTDILQGSVNQAIMPFMRPNVFVVAGVNVALAMELCLVPGPLTAEGVEAAIAMARDSIRLVNTIEVEDGEDDE